MGRPHNWFFNSVNGRWEIRGGKQGVVTAYASEDTLGAKQNLEVGSLTTTPALNVSGVASLGTSQVTNIRAATATIANTNVGSLATVQTLKLGGGNTMTNIIRATGTTPVITNIGTATHVVATLTGIASLGLLSSGMIGPSVICNVRQALPANVAFAGARVNGDNNLNIYLANLRSDTAISVQALSWDIVAISGL